MYVIKKTGRKEKFQERKLFKSVYNACIGASVDRSESLRISKDVMNSVKIIIGKDKEIQSKQLFNHVKRILSKHNKYCAFMYETHRDVS